MKSGLARYAPEVLRRGVFEDPSDGFSSFVGALEDVVRTAAARAFERFQTYLPATRDPAVMREYLDSIGFALPDGDLPRIVRFFEHHREYLRVRGTMEGIRILSFMVTGVYPEITSDFEPSKPCRLGRDVRLNGRRLLDPRIRYVRLKFGTPLPDENRVLLHHALVDDLPVNVRYIIL